MISKIRHILMLSGGKDSTALAIYMRDRVPDMEYVFCDTDKELPETYEYLTKLEYFLGKKIERLGTTAASTTGCRFMEAISPRRTCAGAPGCSRSSRSRNTWVMTR